MDWNRRYREGDTPWDKGVAHPVLDGMFSRVALCGRVLVPGCGVGHDVRNLAARDLEVTGLDVASLALEKARVHARVRDEVYMEGDILAPPAEFRGMFDGVFEHTCFCAIEPWQRAGYAEAVASVLKPGGRLLAVFFLDPDNDGDGPPFGGTREELDGLFGSFFRLMGEWDAIPTFPGREGREILRLMEKKICQP